jgi:endonuclease/exonuclease/phosphatase family metal-dependent hydrolase
MKKRIIMAIAIIAVLSIGNAYSQNKVMTFNIKYDNPMDQKNAWGDRKAELVKLIKEYQPGIIGFQEVLKHQLDYISSELEGYKFYGIGRDNGQNAGEFAPVFIDQSKYIFIDKGTFWLSETPLIPSYGWNAACPRIATYVAVKEKTSGDIIHIINTHYDHRSRQARKESSKLIRKFLKNKNIDQSKAIVMGDLNSLPASTAIDILETMLTDSYNKYSESDSGPSGTFNRFKKNSKCKRRIDYILTRGFSVKSYQNVAKKRRNGSWISDHLPVIIEIQ